MWFWSTQVSAVYYKRLLILLGIVLCGFVLWMGMMEYSVRILKERIGQVEYALKTQMGFPIQYSAIEPHWRLGSIIVTLKDVALIDNETPIPFLSARKLQLVTTPFRLLLNSEQPFNELNIDGMKMVVGWDKGKDLTILGLKGEWFSSSFDYQALLKALSSQKQIRFTDSEVLWQGPKTTILQRIEGKLFWEDVKTYSWQFIGKQQIKLNDKGEFWPVTFVTMQMNTKDKQLSIKADMERTRLEMKLHLPKEDQKSIYIESALEGRDIDLRALHQNVSLTESDPAWLRWLIEALERGSITRGKVNIIGPLDNLNWYGDIAFNNVNLLYNKDWPRIRKASGKVLLEKEQVKVQVNSGNILGAPIKHVEALIAPLGADTSPEVKIEGALSGQLETGIKFLLLSPLKKTLGEHLSPLKPEGLMDLHLNLNIPLGDSQKPVDVRGQLAVEKAVVNVEALDVPMTDIKGLFRFTEKGVEAKGVTAELLDKPVQIEASPQRVTASTRVDSEFLQERFDSHFLRYLTGESLMSVSYLNNGEWVVESSLEGMKIDLPYPYAKKAADSLPITFTVYPADGKENYFGFTAKNTVNAKWTTETKEGETKLKRGQIMLGGKNSEWISNNVLYIGGDVPYLNIEEWKAFLNQEPDLKQEWVTEQEQNQVSENKSEKDAKLEKNDTLEKGDKTEIEEKSEKADKPEKGEKPEKEAEKVKETVSTALVSSKKLPVQINILVGELEAFGLDFKDTAIKHLTNTSEWTLDGPTVKGSMILPTEKHQSLQFSFQLLKLSSKQIDVNSHASHKLIKVKDRIPIIFSAQSLTFDDAWFGETTFRLLPKAYGYEIQELSLRNKASRLEGRGEWRFNAEGEASHLMGEILSDNMSQTFAQWGLTSAMQEGKGRIQFNLQWPGSPFQVSFKKISGAADLKLRSGHILGMNPGLGKVLGLLSLENLVTRRLQLDFSDVLKKGFVFDKLEASMQFKTGMVETDNLFIDGPAAKVKISGVANLSNKEINLQMVVTPKVGNTLPIVAGVATGNPAIGVGVWVVDKLTGSRISEVSQRRYHVTGTWDAPQMNEIGKTRKKGR